MIHPEGPSLADGGAAFHAVDLERAPRWPRWGPASLVLAIRRAKRNDDRGRHPPQERPRLPSAGAAIRPRTHDSVARAFSVTPHTAVKLLQVVQVVDAGRGEAVAFRVAWVVTRQ